MTTWRDSLLKNIHWQPPALKQKEDGKLDFTFRLPLTRILEVQAQKAFAAGIVACAEYYTTRKSPSTVELLEQYKLWGYKLTKKQLAELTGNQEAKP